MRKTYTNKSGYRAFANSGKPVHRWAAAKKLGRPLRTGEVVHHKDRNKQNNSPRNLAIFPNQKAHWEAHKTDAAKHGWGYSLAGTNKRPK
jgi:hypothetical protein